MTALHADFKRIGRWVVWCNEARRWAEVTDGCCGACQADISDRLKTTA